MNDTQRGFTLIEIAAVLALGSMLLLGLSALIDTALEDSKGQQAALYQAQVASAAAKYIDANYGDLVGKAAAAPYVVNLSTLKPDYLSSFFADANVYGQTPCVLVKRRSAAFPDKLDALVVTAGVNKIGEKDIASIAANAGTGGGFIKKETNTTAMAQGGSWVLGSSDLAGFVTPGGCLAGDMSDVGYLASAFFYDSPKPSDDFLHRNKVAAYPALNTMNTPMLMGSGAVAKEGDPCPGAAIAVNDKSDLLSCGNDNRWRQVSTWKTPKATYADLPALDSSGDVRMVLDTNRAFVYNGVTKKWDALAVDQNGNLNVQNDVTAGKNLKAGVDVEAQRDLIARNGNIWALSSDMVKKLYASGTGEYGNVYVEKAKANGVETDWADVNALGLWEAHSPGDKCNLPTNPPEFDPSTGKLLLINPVGTFVVDHSRILLVCAGDQTFRYQNGSYVP